MNALRALRVLLIAMALTACSGNAFNPAANNVALRSVQHATSSSYQQLYAFKGTPDGASPLDGLVAVNGKLYGTTLNGSKNYCSASCGSNGCYLGCGTVFSVDSSGKERVVYNFKGNFSSAHDGSWPFAPLTPVNGVMYGTTSGDGANNEGTFFSVTAHGKEHVLYSFKGGSDAGIPEAALTPIGGKFYGTTVYGGGSGCGGYGCGTVFEVTSAGAERVIYAFGGGTDGERLYSGVAELHHKLYGATLEGGSGCGSTGCGTIYELSLSGKKKTLHSFSGTSDGAYPNGLIAVGGVLYGTTEGGGSKNSGTFFSITPSGTETTLYSFKDNPDGNGPGANLVYYKDNFYGTTVGGGTDGDGTVFTASNTGTESVLYSFAGGNDGSDPQGPVYVFNDALYSTTYKGGGGGCSNNGCGTIFKVGKL